MNHYRLIRSIVLAGLGLLVTASCTTVPGTGRRQINLVSNEYVVQMSMAAFEELKQQTPISTDPRYNALLTRVGERVAQVVYSDMPLADWEFVVFDVPGQVNAFAMPGGKIGIYTGLFQIVSNEEQLASVVAHEIGHVIARHSHERLSQQAMLQAGGNVLSIATSGTGSLASSTVLGIYGIGAQAGSAGWDRGKESEADHLGMIFMARAGYNPEAAIVVMERMADMATGQQNSLFSTHPPSDERALAMHGWLDEARIEYEKAKQYYQTF